MLSSEERGYLRWIGTKFTGTGAAVELGPWLGQSTRCILAGLPPQYRLTTVDDFIWRSAWMDGHLSRTAFTPPGNFQTFLPLFREINAAYLERLSVVEGRLSLYDGNEAIAEFEWTGEPIELLVVDCGRTFEVNETWFRKLQACFIPGESFIVMQDWRLFRETPFKWYNQTRQFTDSKQGLLRLHHEVSHGGLASFLYTGRG